MRKNYVLAIAATLLTASLALGQLKLSERSGAGKRPEGGGVAPFRLTILHNNDGESALLPLSTNPDFGGVARFKTLVDNLKTDALLPGPGAVGVLMISSGDNFLAGPEFNASIENGVPFFDSIAMQAIGYDAITLGNHEFDFGVEVLADFIEGFSVVPPVFISANLDFSLEPSLNIFVPGKLARSTMVEIAGNKIGIIGATTEDLPFISTPEDVIISNVLTAVQNEVTTLKNAGATIIILSSHLQGLGSEFALIPQLADVDVVIGGGGGELLANPGDLLVPGDSPNNQNIGGLGYPRFGIDSLGKSVPLVTTSGDYKYVGRLVLEFNDLGEIVSIDPTSGPKRVSGVAPDAVTPDPFLVTNVQDPVQAAVAALAANIIAQSEVNLDGVNDSDGIRFRETNLGNLTADSLLYTASVNAPLVVAPTPDVAILNGGAIRNNSVIPPGDFTELDTFEILPFANFVSIVPDISPTQFKQIMENCVSRANVPVDPPGGTGRFGQIAGFRLVWDPAGTAQVINSSGVITTPGTRVRELILNDGRVIVQDGQIAPGASAVTIATVNFLATGGDQYPFNGAPFVNISGITYQQSLESFVVDGLGGVISALEYPEGGEGRITRLPPAGLPNGVAAGDVTQTSAVLWARRSAPGPLTFQWSTDPTFTTVDGSSPQTATDATIPVKVEINGLTPATQYYYRVIFAAGQFGSGAFRTPAAPGVQTGLRFGATGDWQQAPPYPSLVNVPARDLDVFLKLGDTIYADTETPALPGIVQARTLGQFRAKHAEVGLPRPEAPSFNTMPALTASTPLLVTIDDHELVDNFAGGSAPGTTPDAPDVNPTEPPLFVDAVPFVNQTQAYATALQAYREYHPTSDQDWNVADPRLNGRPKLYRHNTYGSDASITMLDSRSFRDAQLAPASLADPIPFLLGAFDPTRTLLGGDQLATLQADLLAAEQAGVTWKFVTIPEPIQNFGVVNAEDRFEGYAAERTALLKFINDNDIDNVVFLAGDFHGTLVNNLSYQEFPFGPQIPTNAFEIVTGPAAFFNGLFGPAVANIALAAGLITPAEFGFYQSLPVAPDLDDIANDKDDFLKGLLVAQTGVLGYDPIGLNNNLPQAAGLIDATLLQGDYVSAHLYSWAEFEIDSATQQLLVTIWSIPAYSEADFLANPAGVTALTPQIAVQFSVNPAPL